MPNTNLLQTIMTTAASICAILTTVLLSMGCVDVAGTLSCTATTAPTWLTPYMAGIAMLLTIAKLLLGAFEGKLTAPTVAIPKVKVDK
jgi:hypothetical protein